MLFCENCPRRCERYQATNNFRPKRQIWFKVWHTTHLAFVYHISQFWLAAFRGNREIVSGNPGWGFFFSAVDLELFLSLGLLRINVLLNRAIWIVSLNSSEPNPFTVLAGNVNFFIFNLSIWETGGFFEISCSCYPLRATSCSFTIRVL